MLCQKDRTNDDEMKEEKEEELASIEVGVGKGRNEFMPRRSIWKGSFVDASLLIKMKV